MAYTDKCCGVCGNYIELQKVGNRRSGRFDMGNVCASCLKTKVKNLHVDDLSLHVYKAKEEVAFSRKYTIWFDENGKKVRVPHYKVSFESPEQDRKHCSLCFGSPRPRWYKVYTEHYSKMSGCVSAECKFKLRRVLRKLGVRGDIRRLIK